MSEHLEILKKLTPILSSFNKERMGDYIEYDIDGTGVGYGLWKEPAVAVQRVFMSAGTTFPAHHHKEIECIILYKGSYEITNDITKVYKAGDVIVFPPDMPHYGTALEDSWMICVSVPSGEGYPNAK